jgi:UDP-GlcNAc:undecaprenyl-phosphate GlcNAc-1-phosphate transferase
MESEVIILPIVLSFIATIASLPISLFFISRWKLLDDPKTHKHPAIIHNHPIPRGGSIPFFLGVWVAGIVFLPLNTYTIALFLASFIALIIGVIDDKYDLSRYIRLGANVICALLIVIAGISVTFITNPFGGILHLDSFRFSLFSLPIRFSHIFSILWIIWVMNMLNWSKGVDGQMPGVVAIAAFVIGLLSLRFPLSDQATYISASLSFIITGASLGFLVFNFYPAKIFPGYGATAIYLLLASLSMLSGAKLATAMLVMGVPMVDGIFTIIRRVVSGRSPFWGDKKHLHHLLLTLGLTQRHVALFYWIVSGILGAASLILSIKGKIFAILMLVIIIGGGLLFLHKTLKERHEKNFYQNT